jgi:hypothetical protein
MPNNLATTAALPNEMDQKRELYRQQMAGRIGQPLPDLSAGRPQASGAGAAEAALPAGVASEGAEKTAVQLKAEQAKARAEAGAQEVAEKLKKGDIKGVIQAGAATVAEVGAGLATAQILKFMWLNIWWVLPLFYIDLHFILRYLCGVKAFCKFGQEWTGGKIKAGGVEKGAGQALEMAGQGAELVEIMVMFLCNLIVGAAIFLILTIIYLLVHPCALFEVLSEWVGILKGLYWIAEKVGICKDAF